LRELVARFLGVMREERLVYAGLLALAEKKKDAILDKNTDTLDAIVRQEQALILRLGQMETRRTQCLEDLSDETGRDLPDITLLDWAEYGTPEQSSDVRALHAELGGILAELEEKNNQNRLLLESRMEYVQFALDVLHSGQDPGLYNTQGDGAFSDGEGKTIMDRKV